MATAQFSTTSNRAEIKPGHESAVEALLEEYIFGKGNFDDLSPELHEREDSDEGHRATVSFIDSSPVGPIIRADRLDEPEIDYYELSQRNIDDTIEFFRELADHLETALVIEHISRTKLRYPFGARTWRVDPEDGTISTAYLQDGKAHEEMYSIEEESEANPSEGQTNA